jgi:hypothetical protein
MAGNRSGEDERELVHTLEKATSAAASAEHSAASESYSLPDSLNELVHALRELHGAGGRSSLEVPKCALGFVDEGGSPEGVHQRLVDALNCESAMARSASLQSQRLRASLESELRAVGIDPEHPSNPPAQSTDAADAA